jgi:hypothetical protein
MQAAAYWHVAVHYQFGMQHAASTIDCLCKPPFIIHAAVHWHLQLATATMQVACNSNVTMHFQFTHRLRTLPTMANNRDLQIRPLHAILGVLIALSQDPWHRFHNDHKDALIKTGCWLVILGRTVVFNCTSAPWSDHGFFCQIREAAQEYFSRSWRCPLYALLYEDSVIWLFFPCLHVRMVHAISHALHVHAALFPYIQTLCLMMGSWSFA